MNLGGKMGQKGFSAVGSLFSGRLPGNRQARVMAYRKKSGPTSCCGWAVLYKENVITILGLTWNRSVFAIRPEFVFCCWPQSRNRCQSNETGFLVGNASPV
jgi:hypothetical protein